MLKLNISYVELTLLACIVIHLVMCPLTKVEESFNLQAIHDLLYHVGNINAYDHLEFPGVVPRSFIGPLAVTSLSWPLVFVLKLFEARKFYALLVSRFCLGLLTWFAFSRFLSTVRRQYGPSIAVWLVVIQATQFHFVFYASRTLPNTFALICALFVFSYLFDKQYYFAVAFACFSIVVFRSELVLLYAPLFFPVLFDRQFSIVRAIGVGLLSSCVSLGLTVCIDSYFWQRTLWPEGEVWYYNVILNKSSNWGTHPFYWYFTSALPRALAGTLPFVILACKPMSRTMNTVVLPALGFVGLYSFLPHKELRFIIYVIPLLNLAGANVCSKVFTSCRIYSKPLLRKLAVFFVVAHLLANLAFTSYALYVSSRNYPGGEALRALHRMESNRRNVSVHIDVYCAQTGVSRFLHEREESDWIYDKKENLVPGSAQLRAFHFLLFQNSENSGKNNTETLYADTHTVIHRQYGLSAADNVLVLKRRTL